MQGYVLVFGEDPLVKEVKMLNPLCYNETYEGVFTIDRREMYTIESVHKGISRVLQGFEIIVLTVLTRRAACDEICCL